MGVRVKVMEEVAIEADREGERVMEEEVAVESFVGERALVEEFVVGEDSVRRGGLRDGRGSWRGIAVAVKD